MAFHIEDMEHILKPSTVLHSGSTETDTTLFPRENFQSPACRESLNGQSGHHGQGVLGIGKLTEEPTVGLEILRER